MFFPDVERAEWMNKMIAQMWPFIGDYVRDLLMTQIQKTVQESASVMGSFKFVKIDLGDIVSAVKCYFFGSQNLCYNHTYITGDSGSKLKLRYLNVIVKRTR